MAVTIKEIARLAGVSRGTVDRVINCRPGVKLETRERIEKIIKDLDYRPNVVAKALKSTKNRVTIGVVLGPESREFIKQLRQGVEIARKNYKPIGVEVICTYNADTTEGAVQAIQMLVDKGVDALAVRVVDTVQVKTIINNLADKGIPIVAFNTDLTNCKKLCYVGYNCVEAGRVAGELMGKVLHGKGEVLIVVEDIAVSVHAQRVGAFKSLVAERYPEIKIAGMISSSQDIQNEYQKTLKGLQDNPNITGLYSSSISVGIIRAIRELNLTDKITLICLDLIPSVINTANDDNCIDFLIGQEPQKQGAYAIKVLVDYLYYGIEPEQDKFYCRVDIRVRDTVFNNEDDLFFGGLILNP